MAVRLATPDDYDWATQVCLNEGSEGPNLISMLPEDFTELSPASILDHDPETDTYLIEVIADLKKPKANAVDKNLWRFYHWFPAHDCYVYDDQVPF